MGSIGIDIGSRSVKLVELREGAVARMEVVPNSHDPVAVCQKLLSASAGQQVVATGYGRHLLERYTGCQVLTEIRAASIGVRCLVPGCRTILDIGGQDTKAIALSPDGTIAKFEMNDRCAAGTGKFLELMATALSYTLDDFIRAALDAGHASRISAMCAVFAESEVVSMVARGVPREELALGIHDSVASRSLALLGRLQLQDPIAFIGGGALNAALTGSLSTHLGRPIQVPSNPQFVTALGAALSAG